MNIIVATVIYSKYDLSFGTCIIGNSFGPQRANVGSGPLRAERCRREARRDKFTHKNCTLPTIHLGPAGRRPAWAYDDDDDDDDDYFHYHDEDATGWVIICLIQG